MLELCLSDSWYGRSIRRQSAQQRNKHIQYVNACSGGGYEQIVAMDVSDAVA